jgi:hypothetical protein
VKYKQTGQAIMNRILILLIAAFGCSCSTLPEQYTQAPSRSLVEGVTTQDATEVTRVEIANIDGNPLPISSDYQHVPKQVWLEPGIHKLFVSCHTSYSWGTLQDSAQVEIDVQAGYSYYLTSSAIKLLSDKSLPTTKPQVEVTKKASK